MAKAGISFYTNTQKFSAYSIKNAASPYFCGSKSSIPTSEVTDTRTITPDYIEYRKTANLEWDFEVWAAQQLWQGITFPVSKKGLQIPAIILSKGYAINEFRAKEEIEKIFGELGIVSSRVKDRKSVFSKLVLKAEKTGKECLSLPECKELICDAIGTRLILDKVDKESISDIVGSTLEKAHISKEVFDKHLQGKIGYEDSQNEVPCASLNAVQEEIVARLSEAQTQGFVDALNGAIKSGDIKITELHNYSGLGGCPYLNKKQVQSIADTHYDKYQENLIVNSASDNPNKKGHKAIKDSGYTTLQMNVIHKSGVLGELQIRGSEIAKFAEYEHVPYDIRRGKLFSNRAKYEEIAPTLEKLNEEQYSLYNKYLTHCYKHARLKELGLNVEEFPAFPEDLIEEASLDERQVYYLSHKGLSELSTGTTDLSKKVI